LREKRNGRESSARISALTKPNLSHRSRHQH
jgi:hypothetical protein